jgi:hypothetical protein
MGDSFNKHFSGLRKGSLPSKYSRRLLAELRDHYEDLKAEAMAAGLDQADASEDSLARLGDCEVIVAAVKGDFSLSAHYLGGVLEATNERWCRWLTAMLASASFTAGLLFLLQFALLAH